MEARVDSVGRIVIPKPLRERLGLAAGSTVDVSLYGEGLHIAPTSRTARLERRADGRLVAASETAVSDNDIFDLIDSIRR